MPVLPLTYVVLAFDANNRVAVRRVGDRHGLPFTGGDLTAATQQLEASCRDHTAPSERYAVRAGGNEIRVCLAQVHGDSRNGDLSFATIDALQSSPDSLEPALAAVLRGLDPFLTQIPYLHLSETDFIYKFRPERERNPGSYARDSRSSALYQSKLCDAIKLLGRRHERTTTSPVTLNFGAVEYVIPSHFGFCLGVKNAIERAYETLAANPGRRVFMLSELIHNPFVNEDLLMRGLRYLQTDKGVPFTVSGGHGRAGETEPLLWETLTSEDIVIIPAFGATDEDKSRLVRKGIAVYSHDATCMLVEKVWKAARAYGRDGYTVVIHGKHEHEETKATFANTRRYAPAVIVRNMEETRLLAEIIASDDPAHRARFFDIFAGKHTPGFDVTRDLQRVAVVNQTTLLMNETREIIHFLRETFLQKFGPDIAGQQARVGGSGRSDTLCYATQVNQDALARALDSAIDTAFVIGGKNSSNTYQLYRLCEQRLPGRAFFIQSEASILTREKVEHYVFPSHHPRAGMGGRIEIHSLWPGDCGHKRVLITGGASCPDGIIQQVVTRINSLWPEEAIRSIDDVLADLENLAGEDMTTA